MVTGLLLHIIAKCIFVFSSYIMHLYLGKNLSATEYGVVGVIISVISFSYTFLSNGARQAISKNLASKTYNEIDLIYKGGIIQCIVVVLLMSINYFGANKIAMLMNAPNLSKYIRLTAFIIPFTAGYFMCVGIMNGLKLFIIEAMIVTIYPILRLSVIPFVEVLDDSIIAVIMGFFTAALVCFILSGVYLVVKRRIFDVNKSRIKITIFIKSVLNFLLFFVCITVLLNIDTLIVNTFVRNKDLVGYYTGAVNFGKIPYYLLSAFYIVILPVVTQQYTNGFIKEARNTIIVFFVIISTFIIPIIAIICSSADILLVSFYKTEYRVAGTTTCLLIVSNFFAGIFIILGMLVSATQKKLYCNLVAFLIMIFDIVVSIYLVKTASINGAPIALLISLILGCFLLTRQVNKLIGSFFTIKIAKILLFNTIYFLALKFIFKFITLNNLILLMLIYIILYCVNLCCSFCLNLFSLKDLDIVLGKLKSNKNN